MAQHEVGTGSFKRTDNDGKEQTVNGRLVVLAGEDANYDADGVVGNVVFMVNPSKGDAAKK